LKKGILLAFGILFSIATFAQEQKETEYPETEEFKEESKSSSNDLGLNDFKVFPNPTRNNLTVGIGKLKGGISFQISDAFGQLVYNRKIVSYDLQKDSFKLDMSSFRDGVYMFSLKTKTASKTIKVVKL